MIILKIHCGFVPLFYSGWFSVYSCSQLWAGGAGTGFYSLVLTLFPDQWKLPWKAVLSLLHWYPLLFSLCVQTFLNSALCWKLPLTICDLHAYALVGKAALLDALLAHISCFWAVSVCNAHLLVYPTRKTATPEQRMVRLCWADSDDQKLSADHTAGEELK